MAYYPSIAIIYNLIFPIQLALFYKFGLLIKLFNALTQNMIYSVIIHFKHYIKVDFPDQFFPQINVILSLNLIFTLFEGSYLLIPLIYKLNN